MLEVRRISDELERCYVEEGMLSTVGQLRFVVSKHFGLDVQRTTLISSRGGGWPLSDDGASLAACGISPRAHTYVVDRDVDWSAVAAVVVDDPKTVYVWPHNKRDAWKGRSASEMGMKLRSFFEVFCQCATRNGGFDARKGWATFVFANDVARGRALQLNGLLTLPEEPDIMAISEELPPTVVAGTTISPSSSMDGMLPSKVWDALSLEEQEAQYTREQQQERALSARFSSSHPAAPSPHGAAALLEERAHSASAPPLPPTPSAADDSPLVASASVIANTSLLFRAHSRISDTEASCIAQVLGSLGWGAKLTAEKDRVFFARVHPASFSERQSRVEPGFTERQWDFPFDEVRRSEIVKDDQFAKFGYLVARVMADVQRAAAAGDSTTTTLSPMADVERAAAADVNAERAVVRASARSTATSLRHELT